MKIVLKENQKIRRDEMIMIYHPKNQMLMKTMKELLEARIGEIEVKDEYNNHFFISLLNIYYFEIVDHKIFVYTQNHVYRYYQPLQLLKEHCLKNGFHQVNVRTFVNERHVKFYSIGKHCRRVLILDNEENVVANRRYKEEVDGFIKNRNITMKQL